ncbi:hypothetical protein DF16_orf03970 [Bacillus thuringiensis serovar kurstaki str. YBT-1520]|nr:hypothetical protein DF16_orf03970 [Bacillus thuringiensis serovar kurstaki str. YBT-1520]
MADGVDFLGFDRLISELEQMGLRGEKIEDKALAAGGEPIRKAISEIAQGVIALKKQQKASRGEQDNIWLIIYGLQKQKWRAA